MDVLTPNSLDEALRMKAEVPDAWLIEGGTDVMVALNFDHGRPPALINLNEVRELKGWARDNGSLRLAAGLTYGEIERFFELTDRQLHFLVCSCTLGGRVSGNAASARVRTLIPWSSRLSSFAEGIRRWFS